MTVYKYVELSYTIPTQHTRPILAASRRTHNDQVMLFPDDGGIVAAVTVQADMLDDTEALDSALTAAGAELLQDSARLDIPAPWRMLLVDRDRLADNFVRPTAPRPAPGPAKPVHGCGARDSRDGDEDDGLAGTGAR